MFKTHLIRQVARASAQVPRVVSQKTHPAVVSRLFSSASRRLDKEPSRDDVDAATTSGEPGESGDHEGQYARTQDNIRVEYPKDNVLPQSEPLQGRGGFHFKRTLASFSLEGRVAVVTGGARGLGLVMAQALVTSGADVAIVDLNREEGQRSAQGLVDTYKSENPGTET
jgi:D-arabinitol 2-dehydrogenase